MEYEVYKGQFESFNPDLVLDPGQRIKVGPNLSIQAIPTPGHTWDSSSYWVPERAYIMNTKARVNILLERMKKQVRLRNEDEMA